MHILIIWFIAKEIKIVLGWAELSACTIYLFTFLYTVISEILPFLKHNYQITEIELQILKTINHIKHVCKEGVNRKIIEKKNLRPPLMINILRKTLSKFILKLVTISLTFQKNQSILHQKTLKMKILLMIFMATFYPIKALPINILTTMIQIKLHLITKLI